MNIQLKNNSDSVSNKRQTAAVSSFLLFPDMMFPEMHEIQVIVHAHVCVFMCVRACARTCSFKGVLV